MISQKYCGFAILRVQLADELPVMSKQEGGNDEIR
ncbi:MAG: hypothetical protein BWX58_01634 [Deltaproteobacteria bacterium ADurb.Bin026]|nr:MAG: hypothetical protein BWX58_01634 [Deltaproteobacteria bacterium ADurb.Bin026]